MVQFVKAKLTEDFITPYRITLKAGEIVTLKYVGNAYYLVMGFKSYAIISEDKFVLEVPNCIRLIEE